MKHFEAILLWCVVLVRAAFSMEVQHDFEKHTEINVESDSVRGRRGVIEEEKYYNMQSHRQENNINQPWIPGPLPPEEDPTTKISITNEVKEVLPLYQTTERVTDKPTGRGARASNENWIKLPLPGRDEIQRDPREQRDQRDQRDQREQRDQRDQRDPRDNILTPPQPSGDLINSRMPRVNFVTQNKALEASESRNDKESIQRAIRTDELRTEFVRPDEDRDRDRAKYKPVFPRQAVYNSPMPDESRRYFYDDRYYPVPDDLYRRDPYYDMIDRRRYFPYYGSRVDRYDENYDNMVPRKPKRIIYYAHLPEVVRTPPSVDLRYRYSVDPYRRFDEELYPNARNGRYDYRFRSRYPYSPLRKDERNYRDLAGAGTVVKDKNVEDKVTPIPILPQKEDKFKTAMNANRNLINSHQYHDSADTYNDPIMHKGFPDVVRPDDGYLRFDEPLFQGAVEDPYQRKY